jgi:hypothetical protein
MKMSARNHLRYELMVVFPGKLNRRAKAVPDNQSPKHAFEFVFHGLFQICGKKNLQSNPERSVSGFLQYTTTAGRLQADFSKFAAFRAIPALRPPIVIPF